MKVEKKSLLSGRKVLKLDFGLANDFAKGDGDLNSGFNVNLEDFIV